jgi:hypothetical protein
MLLVTAPGAALATMPVTVTAAFMGFCGKPGKPR